jgi:acyl-CoA synthetase (AMP-forming)/AMP-acid ligase II
VSAGELSVPDVDVTGFVLEHAAERGERPALIDGPSGRTIAYGELGEGIAALRGGLGEHGFEAGDALAIHLPNCPEYALAFHAAASAGGRATTVNPLYTAEELGRQLRASRAKLLLTAPPLLETALAAAEGTGVEEVFVLGDEEAEGATPLSALVEGGSGIEGKIDPANDLAALPYSSGTTGLPKGVMLTHRNLVANLIQAEEPLGVVEGDTMIGCLPFFHIYGMTVIMNMGLRNGATIVTMPRFDLGEYMELIERHRATVSFIVPPIALALARHPAVDDADLSSLRMLMSGAAPLGPELIDELSERLGCTVIQGYGMTETSPVTHTIPAAGPNKPGTIGPALRATECRLVDPESGEDVGDGERGELWIRGPQVMRGYLDDEESTAATIDADGWLHTGDVGVVDEDGYYSIVDRLKELIKFKGYQVPPAELEALILGHPQVADVAVVGVQDEEAGELPKAFVVVAEGDGELDHDELMAWVGERVAPQKRVRLVEEIAEIPKSPSGKILRRELH